MMKNKLVLRFQKIKSVRAIRGALAHNLRLQDTPNANVKLLKDNQHFGQSEIDECMQAYRDLVQDKTVRKNAVHSIEVVISASSEALNAMTFEERTKFFGDSLEWLDSELGGRGNLINAVVHNDELTPHLHAIYVPIKDNKLNCRHFIGESRSRLSQLQTAFATKVGKKHGLTRGEIASKASHTTVKEYSALTKKIETVQAEHDHVQHLYELAQEKLQNIEDEYQLLQTAMDEAHEVIVKERQAHEIERQDYENELMDLRSSIEAMRAGIEAMDVELNNKQVLVSDIRSLYELNKSELDTARNQLINVRETAHRTFVKYLEPLVVSVRKIIQNMTQENLAELHSHIEKYDAAKVNNELDLPGKVQNQLDQAIQPLRPPSSPPRRSR